MRLGGRASRVAGGIHARSLPAVRRISRPARGRVGEGPIQSSSQSVVDSIFGVPRFICRDGCVAAAKILFELLHDEADAQLHIQWMLVHRESA